MKDLIDRQAAIDTEGLNEEIRCEMCRNPMHTDRGCDGNCRYDEKLYKKIIQILDKRINPLPSAQPDVPDADGDMISRKFMCDLGATCIARRDDDGKLIALGRIDMLPSAQPERKTGKWILDDEYIDCSACKREKWSRVPYESLVKRFRFCPNCGADMRGEA